VAASKEGTGLGAPQQLEVEHRQIHRRAERIAAAVAAGNEADVRAGLKFLSHYLEEHFRHEELCMEEEGYPGLLEHARVHAGLVARLSDARRALELVGTGALVVKEIARELQRHVEEDDRRLARFRTARESLRRMAFRSGGGGLESAPARSPASPIR
jgi:hemerythrin-like metal-binding protein